MQDELRQQNIAALLARGLSRTRKKNGLLASEPSSIRTMRFETREQNGGTNESVTDSVESHTGGDK